MLARIADTGVGIDAEQPSAWRRLEWRYALPPMEKLFAWIVQLPHNSLAGWNYIPPEIGVFGTKYDLRAAIALTGLLALPPEEATYFTAVKDGDGHALNGAHRYHWRVPPSGIPVNAFWSLSMYKLHDDGRMFFSANPIARYAIGDRTPDLQRNADGSIDILIQRDRPADTRNWLPAPEGDFRMVLRAYQPAGAILNRSFRCPPVERLN